MTDMIGLIKMELLVVKIARLMLMEIHPKWREGRAKLKYKDKIVVFFLITKIVIFLLSLITCAIGHFNIKKTRVVHVLMKSMEHFVTHVNSGHSSCMWKKGGVV